MPAKHKVNKKPQSLQDFARHLGQNPQSAQVDDTQDGNAQSLADFAAKIGREDTSYQNIGQESHQELHQNNRRDKNHLYGVHRWRVSRLCDKGLRCPGQLSGLSYRRES